MCVWCSFVDLFSTFSTGWGLGIVANLAPDRHFAFGLILEWD